MDCHVLLRAGESNLIKSVFLLLLSMGESAGEGFQAKNFLGRAWERIQFIIFFASLDFLTSHTGTVLGNPKVQGSEGRGLRTEREGIGKSQHE